MNNEENYFIYRLRLSPKYQNGKNWTNSTQETIQEHVNFLNELGNQGKLIFAGRTDLDLGNENQFGIALILAHSQKEAEEMMAKDPGVEAGIHLSEVYPFRLAISHFKNII